MSESALHLQQFISHSVARISSLHRDIVTDRGTDVPRVPRCLTDAISAYTAEFALLHTADNCGSHCIRYNICDVNRCVVTLQGAQKIPDAHSTAVMHRRVHAAASSGC